MKMRSFRYVSDYENTISRLLQNGTDMLTACTVNPFDTITFVLFNSVKIVPKGLFPNSLFMGYLYSSLNRAIHHHFVI